MSENCGGELSENLGAIFLLFELTKILKKFIFLCKKFQEKFSTKKFLINFLDVNLFLINFLDKNFSEGVGNFGTCKRRLCRSNFRHNKS